MRRAVRTQTIEGPQKEEFALQSEILARLIVTQSLGIILDWANRTKDFISGPKDLHYLTLLIHALLSIYLRPSLPSSPSPSPTDLLTLSDRAGTAFDLALHFDPALAIAVDPEELEELISNATIREPHPPPDVAMDEDGEKAGKWQVERAKLASWIGEGGGEVVEACPGCEEEVRFADLEIGVCKEEHVFGESTPSSALLSSSLSLLTNSSPPFVPSSIPSADRCSLTLVQISAPQSRKCLSCTRSALVPPSLPVRRKSRRKPKEMKIDEDEKMEVVAAEEEGEEKKEWLRAAVLEVGRLCLYCGGRFGLAM